MNDQDNNGEIKETYDEADRVIPKQMEEAYRLVAGEFGGLSVTEAAQKMGVSQGRVSQILAEFRKKAPQLFPLITADEYRVLSMLKVGASTVVISEYLGMTERAVTGHVSGLIKKRRWSQHKSKTVAYSNAMDGKIVDKF